MEEGVKEGPVVQGAAGYCTIASYLTPGRALFPWWMWRQRQSTLGLKFPFCRLEVG